jgi:linoleoyl-CoA desaturase
MKTVKFINQTKPQADKPQFAATLRKNVNDYFKEKGISTKGNTRMVLKAIAMLAIYFVPFILILTLPMAGWLMFPLALVMGIGMAGIGMSVMHDAVHGSFSKIGWLNKLVGNTMFMIGGNVFTWKVQHNILHHTYTNIEGYDEDIDSKVVLRLSKQTPLKRFHKFQFLYAFFFYGLLTLSKLIKDFFQLHEYNKSGVTKEQKAKPGFEFSKMIVSKAIYLFIGIGLPILLSGFSWWMVLLGFLTMHLTAGVIMSVIFQLAHLVEGVDQPVPSTEGNIENEWTIHELETTSNFAQNNKLLSWYIGGLNFQIEHHLFPNVCHIHYKKIAPIVKRTALEFGLKYNVKPTFINAIGSHVRTLKALGKN